VPENGPRQMLNASSCPLTGGMKQPLPAGARRSESAHGGVVCQLNVVPAVPPVQALLAWAADVAP